LTFVEIAKGLGRLSMNQPD